MASKLEATVYALDSSFHEVSRRLWPLPLPSLWFVLAALTGLDHFSTFMGLRVVRDAFLYEANGPSRVALELGGFAGLLLWDIVKVSTLLWGMSIVQRSQERKGLPGLGRLLHVVMLLIYGTYALLAAINNFWLVLSP